MGRWPKANYQLWILSKPSLCWDAGKSGIKPPHSMELNESGCVNHRTTALLKALTTSVMGRKNYSLCAFIQSCNLQSYNYRSISKTPVSCFLQKATLKFTGALYLFSTPSEEKLDWNHPVQTQRLSLFRNLVCIHHYLHHNWAEMLLLYL